MNYTCISFLLTLPLFSVVIFSFLSSDYYTHEASSSISLKVCIVIQKGSVERDISLTMVAKKITGEKIVNVQMAYSLFN